MNLNSQSVAVDARQYVFPPLPELLHVTVRTGAGLGANVSAAREVDHGRSFAVSVSTASPLGNDLMRAIEEYVGLIGCLKQLDDVPAGYDALRARRERDAFESLARVRRAIHGLCRERGLD